MKKIVIVGILNTTPDSYWDGGEHTTIDAALKRAEQMIAEGVDIIEVGGESTGPGSKDISESEELKRTMPIIAALHQKYPNTPLAVDTYKAGVAKAALGEGVAMVNDVTAGRGDENMLSVVASSQAKIVLMYAKDTSARTTKEAVQYDDVIQTVTEFLAQRIQVAQAAGVKKEHIILDPGLGHFVSSDPQYSFTILARLAEIVGLGYPIFVSPSRKSFLAGPENLKTADRLPGTIAASALAVVNGATYIRTHDVAAVRQGCEIAAATLLSNV